ncbi:unnamed protein product [Caenorhabditis bovis]|uniref:Uncharacterized protein n=1 Tax=Caenorhabditis bovis TaxID=2654633 RepID=A0A8S1EH24_9PELO|nr:unnamed protein product [Caenorhabditis bovis]
MWSIASDGTCLDSTTNTNTLAIQQPLWIKNTQYINRESVGSQSPNSDLTDSPEYISPYKSRPSTSNVVKIRNVRKSTKYKCSVCGDRPTGFHYNVLSCNGCKTFFRRTIISNRKFVCARDGRCEFNKDFRCACRSCRFNKCIRVGMNKDSIQLSATKKKEMEMACGEDEEDNYEIPQENALAISMPKSDKLIRIFNSTEAVKYREDGVLRLRKFGKIVMDMNEPLISLLQKGMMMGKDMCFAVPEFARENEKMKMVQLYNKNPVRYWMVSDLFLIVEFAKSFSAFRKLSLMDQEVLMKHVGGVLHSVTQSFYSMYSFKSGMLTFPDGINALDFKMKEMNRDKRLKTFKNYYAEAYCLPIEKMADQNMTLKEFSLFKAICLFSPDSLKLSEQGREIVRREREYLMNLLRNHLLIEHGYHKGMCMFSNILMSITTFIKFGEKRRNHILLMNLMQCELARIGIDIFLP